MGSGSGSGFGFGGEERGEHRVLMSSRLGRVFFTFYGLVRKFWWGHYRLSFCSHALVL